MVTLLGLEGLRLLPDQRGEIGRSGLALPVMVPGGEVSEFGFKMDDIAVTFDESCREGADRTF